MNNCLKALCIVFIMMTISCKKEDNSGNTPVDYSKFRIKQQIHDGTLQAYSDTTTYYYSGDDIQTRQNRSNNPTYFYTTNYVKVGSQYNYSTIYGLNNTHEGFLKVNAMGYIDTSRVTVISSGAYNNRSKYYYNAAGYPIREINNYNTYESDIKRYYNSSNDYSYQIYDFTHFTNPALSYKDSSVYEFYTDKDFLVNYDIVLPYGMHTAHLLKKKSNYRLTSGGALVSTREYFYELDAIGLVKKLIVNVYNQPGNVLYSSDTTTYSYIQL
ncbi:MAG TPA: hypothetical protein PLF48_09425 [Chitinophagales bacterium]|nr:hypothetical protein [Chitinophagales bacterium]